MLEQFIFYFFAAIALGSAVMVVTSRHPVHCALFLVLTFIASAGLWILAYAEFLALILVLVYVGAVMTLFLFVVMMLDIEVITTKQYFVRYLPFVLLIGVLLAALIVLVVKPEYFAHLGSGVTLEKNNVNSLGLILYTDYAYALELAAALLLVAIVAAIALTHRPTRHAKKQDVRAQLMVDSKRRIRLVKGKTND